MSYLKYNVISLHPRCSTWTEATLLGEPWTMWNYLPLPCVPSLHTELLLQSAGIFLKLWSIGQCEVSLCLRKVNLTWINALPRLRRVAQSSQVKLWVEVKKFFTILLLQAFFSWPRQRESLRDSGLPAWWIQQMWQITPVLDESFIWKCQDGGVFTNWHPGPWGISGLCFHSDIWSMYCSPSVSEKNSAPFYHLSSLNCSFM